MRRRFYYIVNNAQFGPFLNTVQIFTNYSGKIFAEKFDGRSHKVRDQFKDSIPTTGEKT